MSRTSVFEKGSPRKSNLARTISKQKQQIKPRIKPPVISNFIAEDIKEFKTGLMVEHQRFGKGEIVKLEGESGNQKALIDFVDYGKKTLVLKFAKLRRI